jgi:hypothetical protein
MIPLPFTISLLCIPEEHNNLKDILDKYKEAKNSATSFHKFNTSFSADTMYYQLCFDGL